MIEKLQLSIIVCTYNRAQLLKLALESLIKQTAKKNFYEVIVIDNNSSDETKIVVDDFIKKNPHLKIRYFCEENQGLSYARNAGCQAAKTSYLAYLDDDAKIPKDWVEKILQAIEKVNPEILGGPIYPYYLVKKPYWFKDDYKIRSQGNQARFLKDGEFLSGSNFIIKRSILLKLGKFSTLLGMKGKKLGYGEETKTILTARRKIKNVKIFYDPKIQVKHLVTRNKMTLFYRLKSSYFSGKYGIRIFTKPSWGKTLFEFIKAWLVIILGPLFGLFFRDGKRYKYYQNYLYEIVLPNFSFIGQFFAMVYFRANTPAFMRGIRRIFVRKEDTSAFRQREIH